MSSRLLTAVVLGEGSLPIRCAELLLNKGWTIRAVVSLDPAVVSWAQGRGLTSFGVKRSAELQDCLGALEFDCLFSVVNSLLLKEEIINLARRGAVNYHDSLLPNYAGLNAATWALIQGESNHGITWHELTVGVDEGDVLVQVPVAIAPDETSLTLNVKCYEAAIAGFETLVQQLEQGAEQPRSQDLSQRTYFAGWARPWAAGLLDFRQEADVLSRLVRGLSFGPGYFNSLTLPKLWLGNRWVVVEQLTLASRCSDALPGEVLATDSKGIAVSTATEDVVLSDFRHASGARLEVQELGLAVGQVLPQLAQPEALQALSEQVAREERFWTKRLKSSESFKLTWLEQRPRTQLTDSKQDSLPVASSPWILPEALRDGLIKSAAPFCEANQAFALAMTTVVAAYLSRLSDEDFGDLAFSGPEQQAIASQGSLGIVQGTNAIIAPEASCFVSWVPMRMQLSLGASINAALAVVAKERAVLAKRGSYAADLQLREPQLESVSQLPMAVTWLMDGNPSRNHLGEGQILNLNIEVEQCYWGYDPEWLTAEAIARFQASLERFIADIVTQPQVPLSEHSLIADAERQIMLVDWNQTESNYSWNCCTHHLFESQVVRSPKAIALQYGDAQLTYNELNQRANQVAHALLERSIQPDNPVGVHMDRSLEMIIALLGVLKAGGCYLPIDPDYPRNRRLLMVEDAEPKVILTQSHHRGELDHDCELCLDDANLGEGLSTENPAIDVEPHHLAYIIYTSGSTGRPKGVMIEHRSLSNFAQAGCEDYGIGGGDRVLQFASISFDAAAEEIYPCLISGGTLVLRAPEMMDSVPQFIDSCERYGLTVLDLPTAYWHLLVAELDEGAVKLPDSVRIVIIGGEAVNFQRVAQWQKMLWRTGCRAQLLNTYGPTEATVVATAQRLPLPKTEPTQMPVVTIGRPLRNVNTYILDKNLQPLPLGAAGELCVGGAGLARGYLKQPEKTAEQFVASPFNPSERLYRTGDLVRYLPDGEIDYLGRIDNQVKIRGFRIELGEIETLLVQQDSLEDAVVIAREDQPGQRRLVAYVVAKDGAEVVPEQLRQALGEKLPDYMVPVAFVSLVELPMTPNEKVDRKALPVPDLASLGGDRQDSTFVAPKTEIEKSLAKLWENILGISPVGRRDHFLMLGGDSLSAMRLCMQIEREFGEKLLLSTLFQNPLLGELAEILQGGAVASQSCVLPLQAQGSKPPLFFVNCAQDANQIASYLGDDYRIYGLNLFGATERLFDKLDGFEMRMMAQVFVDDIREIQPEGPYYLSSYCGDTRLAVELAQEFQRQGDEVALLALMDPWWNDDPPTLAYHWQTLRHFGLEYAADKLKEKANALWVKGLVARDRWNAKLRQVSKQAPSIVDRDVEVYRTYKETSAGFKPSPYEGYTVLMFSEELQIDQTGEIDEVFANFSDYGYEMLSVPGYHHALFYPESLEVLGGHLRWAIDSAQEKARQSRSAVY